MGKLSELALPTTEVEVGKGQSITVRGLSFLDVSTLFREHAATLDKLYKEHVVERKEMPPADQMAKALLTETPELVANIIAMANDEPSSAPMVARLPGITQVNALLEIARLTFHSEDEVGKVLETVIEGAGVLSNLLGTARNQGLPNLQEPSSGR